MPGQAWKWLEEVIPLRAAQGAEADIKGSKSIPAKGWRGSQGPGAGSWFLPQVLFQGLKQSLCAILYLVCLLLETLDLLLQRGHQGHEHGGDGMGHRTTACPWLPCCPGPTTLSGLVTSVPGDGITWQGKLPKRWSRGPHSRPAGASPCIPTSQQIARGTLCVDRWGVSWPPVFCLPGAMSPADPLAKLPSLEPQGNLPRGRCNVQEILGDLP